MIGQLADDVFIAKLDMNGNPIWGKYAGNAGGLGLETGDFWVDPVDDILYFVGYWAAANNLNKMSSPTNSVKSIFLGKEGEPNSASITEINSDNFSMLIYPNPSDGIYYISKLVNVGDIDYHVLDIQGNLILSGKMKNNKEYIDLSDFSSGLYLFRTNFGSTKLLKR